MTAHVPMARVPFAPLDNPRLQHLASAKNRQNGVFSKMVIDSPMKSFVSPGKRSFESSAFDAFDGENVDPAVLDSPSKKIKGESFEKPSAPFRFALTTAKPLHSGLSFSTTSSTPIRASAASPRTPMTAPAGRSPKRKTAGVTKSRRVSAPFARIDPPSATSRTPSSMPFSLDAALSGTFSTPMPKPSRRPGATIQESMPNSWFFEIHTDTPDEEAANLMEHSTLTLDLSSDEESTRKERDDRGKENTPPEGYSPAAASRAAPSLSAQPTPATRNEIVRKRVIAVDEMEDGQRSPLSDLETESFIPEGLHKDSHGVVDGPTDAPADGTPSEPLPEASDSAPSEPTPPVSRDAKPLSPVEVPSSDVLDAAAPVKIEITVWEDNAAGS